MTTAVWLLAVLLALGALYGLFRAARQVWRQTKQLGSAVGAASRDVSEVTAALAAAQADLPRDAASGR